MGKTTLAMKLILQVFRIQVDRIIVVCPTYQQKTYDDLRPLVNDRDVYSDVSEKTLEHIWQLLLLNSKTNSPQRILLLLDDVAGSKEVYAKRTGTFAKIAIQTPHWNVSLMILSQQPTSVAPAFRQNAENIIIFPCEGQQDFDWIKKAYQSIAMEHKNIKNVVLYAWRGGLSDNTEWGLHFLFIRTLPRQHTHFYLDFTHEIVF